MRSFTSAGTLSAQAFSKIVDAATQHLWKTTAWLLSVPSQVSRFARWMSHLNLSDLVESFLRVERSRYLMFKVFRALHRTLWLHLHLKWLSEGRCDC
jgi:hypothetical protein